MPLIPDQLRGVAARYPDQVGFSVAGRWPADLTLGRWNADASRLARGLVDRGVHPGDRVALLVTPEDALRFVVAYAATHKAGAVAVPVNVRMSPAEVTAVLGHCEPTAVVVTDPLLPLLSGLTGLRAVIATGGPAGHPDPPAPPVVRWAAALDDDDSDLQVPRDPDDLAEILYTSGTTGMPKGVAIRHSNSALMLFTEPTWSGGCWLHASPMFTFAGITFVYQPMRMGLRTLYQPKFDAAEWLRLVAEQCPQATFLVPSMVELLLAEPGVADADLSSLQLVTVGSAPVAPGTLLRLQQLVPQAMVANSYSMTEAGTAYCLLPKGELARRPGSVGKPLPPAEIRVVDSDGQPLPADRVGEIVVKPAGKMREYYRDPEASARVFAADGWLRTGDLGRFDDDGYLYVVGRSKDVIIRGGYNIYATDVESVLYEHPAVREAAVVGVAHPVLGEDVAAVVVLRAEATASADELTAHCRERLADYKVPRRFEFVAELPRNATGKVLKRELVASLAPAQPAGQPG